MMRLVNAFLFSSVLLINQSYAASFELNTLNANNEFFSWNKLSCNTNSPDFSCAFLGQDNRVPTSAMAYTTNGYHIRTNDFHTHNLNDIINIVPERHDIKNLVSVSVMVGNNGQVWELDAYTILPVGAIIPSNTEADLSSIAHDNESPTIIVAVGAHGTIITARVNFSILYIDRKYQMTPVASEVAENLHFVTYLDHGFIAAGNQGTIITSSNGKAWQQFGDSSSIKNIDVYSLTDANGILAGTGKDAQSGQGVVILSKDQGQTWTIIHTNTFLQRITYGNDRLLGVDGSASVLLSTDKGASWQQINPPTSNHLNDVYFYKGEFIAAGTNNTIMTSADGENWVNQEQFQ